MRRGAVVAVVGALLLLIGALALRSLVGQTYFPPWVVASSWIASAVVAVAGMAITARLLARPGVMDEAGVDQAPQPLMRFQVESSRGRRLVAANDVEWLEAKGNYARLHTAGEALLYRMSLSRLEQQLEPQRFVRVHRSAIVNLDSIRRIEPLPSGDAVLHLESGANVRMSRRFARRFHQANGRDATRSRPPDE